MHKSNDWLSKVKIVFPAIVICWINLGFQILKWFTLFCGDICLLTNTAFMNHLKYLSGCAQHRFEEELVLLFVSKAAKATNIGWETLNLNKVFVSDLGNLTRWVTITLMANIVEQKKWNRLTGKSSRRKTASVRTKILLFSFLI